MRSKKLPQSDIKAVFGKLSTPELRYSTIVGHWRAAGYPEDEATITRMLMQLGYNSNQINRAFDTAGRSDIPAASANELIVKVRDYIVRQGIKDEVVRLMAEEYGFSVPVPNSKYGRFKQLFKRLSEEGLLDTGDTVSAGAQYNNDDLLSEEQYNKILQELDKRLLNKLNASRIKRKIVKAWKRGMHKRTHYNNLLRRVDLLLSGLF